ncbi:hypothetical protein ACLB2K_076332 [Fragaria x ananassa]
MLAGSGGWQVFWRGLDLMPTEFVGFSAAADATRVSILLGLFKLCLLLIDLGGDLFYLEVFDAVAAIALLLYVGCYQLSFGPIGWLMISEIFPVGFRGQGPSIGVLNSAANALITFAFSPLKALPGDGILFYVFGAIAVASLAFIFLIVPETKGLSLEEIEEKCL